jgi:hypothetical protein
VKIADRQHVSKVLAIVRMAGVAWDAATPCSGVIDVGDTRKLCARHGRTYRFFVLIAFPWLSASWRWRLLGPWGFQIEN